MNVIEFEQALEKWLQPTATEKAAAAPEGNFKNGDVVINLERQEVRHGNGRRAGLSRRETALLSCLTSKLGTPVSRAELLTQVWQLDPRRTFTRTIDMHISMLRKKLGDSARRPALLITVYGVGYMLRSAVAV